MCSYKVVNGSFEVWGLQTKVEDFIQRGIRDILLLGHRQAFAWIDEWHGMTLEDVRTYEKQKQAETNEKVQLNASLPSANDTDVATNGSTTPTKKMMLKSINNRGSKKWTLVNVIPNSVSQPN